MPTLTINNYTRYNTLDLEAIVSHVERYVAIHAGSVKPRNNLSSLEFNSFTAGNPRSSRRQRYYNPQTQRYENINTKLYLGKTSWRNLERFSLVQPQYAFSNELEWLAMAATDTPAAPAAMVQAVAEAVAERYDLPWNRDRPQIDTSHLRLRIDGEVAARKTVDQRRSERLGKAENNLKAALYDLHRVQSYLRNISRDLGTARKHMKSDANLAADFTRRVAALVQSATDTDVSLVTLLDVIKAERGGGNA